MKRLDNLIIKIMNDHAIALMMMVMKLIAVQIMQLLDNTIIPQLLEVHAKINILTMCKIAKDLVGFGLMKQLIVH